MTINNHSASVTLEAGARCRRAAWLGALLATAVAAPALAQTVSNPGFETGDTTGWTTNGGYWYSGSYPPDASEYAGPAVLASIQATGGTDAITGAPTVFAGNYSLRLNDQSGGNDITSLQQTVTNYGGNKLYYAWNAVLQPSHGATDSPSFLIKVTDLTTNTIVTNIGYSAYTAQNTTIFRSVNGYVTTDWKVEDVDVTTGHNYQLLFIAIDCLYGGHGGYVYVDGFGNAIPLANPGVSFNPATDVVKGASILIPISATPDIDTAQPFYTTTALLAGSVNPNFVGGTLQADGAGPILTAFTVQSQGGFIDTNGNDIEFSGDITGSAGGSLAKIGLGKLTLSGLTTLDNDFVVDAGVLNLPGTLSVLNARVNSGGTLQGTGNVVGNLIVGSGGRVAPGAGIGTLKVVGGNVTMGAGSVLGLDIDGRTYSAAGGSGTYDRLAITSGGFAAGGAIAPVLRGIAAPATNTFTPVLGDVFTVVTADSVTGQFASVTQPASGLGSNTRFDVFYNPKNVQLVVTPASFRTLGLGNGWKLNGVAAATGLDAVRPAAGTRAGTLQSLFNGLYGMTEPGYRTAFQQISGEIHANTEQASQAAARARAGTVLDAAGTTFTVPCEEADKAAAGTEAGADKPRSCLEGNHPAIWTRVYHEETSVDDDATATGYETGRDGFIAGLHLINTADTRLGFGGGHSTGDVKSPLGYFSDVDGYSIFAYASQQLGPLTVSAMGGYSEDDVKTQRDQLLTGGTVVSRAGYGISHTDLAIEARTVLPIASKAALRPVIGLSYEKTTADAVSEVNVDPNLALSLPKESWSTTQLKLGAEAVIGVGNPVTATLKANWLNTLDGDPTVRRTVNLGPASWEVASAGVKNDTFEFGAGVTAQLSPGAQLRMEYTGVRGGGYSADRGTIGVAIAF